MEYVRKSSIAIETHVFQKSEKRKKSTKSGLVRKGLPCVAERFLSMDSISLQAPKQDGILPTTNATPVRKMHPLPSRAPVAESRVAGRALHSARPKARALLCASLSAQKKPRRKALGKSRENDPSVRARLFFCGGRIHCTLPRTLRWASNYAASARCLLLFALLAEAQPIRYEKRKRKPHVQKRNHRRRRKCLKTFSHALDYHVSNAGQLHEKIKFVAVLGKPTLGA